VRSGVSIASFRKKAGYLRPVFFMCEL